MSSGSTASTSTGQWPPRRPSQRSKLRNGTFIIPSTGERSRRQFTLRRALRNQVDGPTADDYGYGGMPFFSRESMSERLRALGHNTKTKAGRFRKWLNSPTGRGVLKCTLAYTLASLATFLSPLSNFLGKPDGKHVVATITVYFHPSRTAGSMIEAILIAIVLVTYAEIISVLSMSVSVFFGSTLGLVRVAHALVLIVFIGGGFGLLGWAKQRLNNPLVNVGSTLASLAIISVVTKENAVVSNVFSNQKIVQVLKMLVMGITTTTAVNLLVWRVSARDLVRKSTSKASTTLGDMLSMITQGFLTGSEEELHSVEYSTASESYASGYPRTLRYLRDAKFEYYFLGYEKIYQLDRAVVRSLETLAQSVGGLRSAANTQFALLKLPPSGLSSEPLSPGSTAPLSPGLIRSSSSVLKSGKDRVDVMSAIDEVVDEGNEEDRDGTSSADAKSKGSSANDAVRVPSLRSPSDIFELFITLLGPSMKSLAYTLSEVLREPPFGGAPNYEVTVNDQFRHSLTDALLLFNNARANALQELYKHIELGWSRSEKVKADFEEVAAACGHFSFSLQTFGEEMQKYLDVLDDLKHANQHKNRSWRWIMFWKDGKSRNQNHTTLPYEDPERETLIEPTPRVRPIRKSATPRGIPDAMIERRDTYSWEVSPMARSAMAAFSQWLLKSLRKLARDDIRFGLKVGIGATLWAMFAFIPETRDTYQHWRGEWGLLSFMIVCSMTVGASNTTGWARFLGTLIGAGACFVNWNISQGNALALIILGWFVAFWSFWMIVGVGKAPLGRITLLAYNVTTLYAYSLSQKVDDDDDDEGGTNPNINEIVKHRAIAVTAGIIWGLIVCRLVWPISARKKFKEGLSVLYLQMGLIWKRGPLAILLRSDCSRSYLKSGEQVALQRYASRLESLRTSATSEFELRGPFPFSPYGRIMASTNRILDAFYAMSLVTQRRGSLSDGEKALLFFTAQERAQLCDRICHVFQVLASSVMLEYPLTDAVPSVAGSRDRLLGRIFQFRKNHAPSGSGDAAGGDGAGEGGSSGAKGHGWPLPLGQVVVEERDYALLYAYALVTGQVAEELKVVEKEIEGLFGVLNENALLLQ